MSKELYVDDVNVEGLLTGWFDNGSGMESGGYHVCKGCRSSVHYLRVAYDGRRM